MKQFDVICPICGRLNKGLYLEETNRWMECENCHIETMSGEYMKQYMKRVPCYTMAQFTQLADENAF